MFEIPAKFPIEEKVGQNYQLENWRTSARNSYRNSSHANGECVVFMTGGQHSGNDFPTFYFLIFSFFNSILPPALSPVTYGFMKCVSWNGFWCAWRCWRWDGLTTWLGMSIQLHEHIWHNCWVCDPGKIFLTSEFNYLLVEEYY